MATILRTSALRAALGAGLTLAAVPPALAQAAPDDDGCAGVIARWREFSARENDGGHMDQPVFDQIQADIDRASRLCEAGQDAQARRLVTGSRRRHGY